MNNTNNLNAAKGRSRILWWVGALAGIAGIIAFGAYAWSKRPLVDCLFESRPMLTVCLSANEFGDLLAGFFSPLAFVAAIFAIFLQTRELAAQRREITLNSEFNSRQTKIFDAELASGLHRDFVSLLAERTRVWKKFNDNGRTVTGEDEDFWKIVAYFQRLTFLIDRGYIDPIQVGEFMHHNAAWWHINFFTHDRCGVRSECPRAEMIPAIRDLV